MAMKVKAVTKRPPMPKRMSRIFRVGDRVVLPFGFVVPAIAIVVADRGNIGLGGRQILALRIVNDDPSVEQDIFELAADDVKLFRNVKAHANGSHGKPVNGRGTKRNGKLL